MSTYAHVELHFEGTKHILSWTSDGQHLCEAVLEAIKPFVNKNGTIDLVGLKAYLFDATEGDFPEFYTDIPWFTSYCSVIDLDRKVIRYAGPVKPSLIKFYKRRGFVTSKVRS